MPSRNRKPETRKENSMNRFLKDFKGGMAALGNAIERILQYRQVSGGTKLVENHKTIEREKIQNIMVPNVLERELIVGRQAVAQAPFREHPKRLIADYQNNVQKVVAAGIPQFLAGMLQSEAVRPTSGVAVEALRPIKGGAVEALMKVAKSIKAGRLPFVPKETRAQAQELLNSIYSKRNGRPSTWQGKDIAQLIEKHRLIPLAAQTQPSRQQQYENFTHAATSIALPKQYENFTHATTSSALPKQYENFTHAATSSALPKQYENFTHAATSIALSQHTATSNSLLKESEARRLETVLPRFRDEGVGSGPKIIDAGESTMHTDENTVVYRDNSPHVSGAEEPLPPKSAAIRPDAAAATRYRSPKPTTREAAAAPPEPKHKPSKPDASKNSSNPTSGGLGSQTGGGTVGAAGGAVEITGTLEIAGMADWVAEVKRGMMKNV
jgi:hypothetical protein